MMADENTIRINGDAVYEAMQSLHQGGTFVELQNLCHTKDTDLCFALMYLLKEKKIIQMVNNNIVIYKVGKPDETDDFW